jgi:hypothetical protein
LVPAPTRPKAIMDLKASSLSASLASFIRVAIIFNLGLEIFMMAMAKGTALLITGSSQYWSIWLRVLETISPPISSEEAMKAILSTAAAW